MVNGLKQIAIDYMEGKVKLAALCCVTREKQTAEVIKLQEDNIAIKKGNEQLLAAFNNTYLRDVLNLIDHHKGLGYDAVDIIDIKVQEIADSFHRFDSYLVEDLRYDEKNSIIPTLRKLGYLVKQFDAEWAQKLECPFTVRWDCTA